MEPPLLRIHVGSRLYLPDGTPFPDYLGTVSRVYGTRVRLTSGLVLCDTSCVSVGRKHFRICQKKS